MSTKKGGSYLMRTLIKSMVGKLESQSHLSQIPTVVLDSCASICSKMIINSSLRKLLSSPQAAPILTVKESLLYFILFYFYFFFWFSFYLDFTLIIITQYNLKYMQVIMDIASILGLSRDKFLMSSIDLESSFKKKEIGIFIGYCRSPAASPFIESALEVLFPFITIFNVTNFFYLYLVLF
jgi:hypothetical protein